MTQKEWLVALINEAQIECDDNYGMTHSGQMADYLLENGVILPPCKVGDIVYQLDSAGEIYESEATQVIYSTKGIAFDERAIGRTVFLTREEAEAALENMKGARS